VSKPCGRPFSPSGSGPTARPGRGNWPGPYEKESAHQGRYKYEQIMRTGADVVLLGCSNCRDQIRKRIPKYYPDAKYTVTYLWEAYRTEKAGKRIVENLAYVI
jgi:Fe-S oxidoreductase